MGSGEIKWNQVCMGVIIWGQMGQAGMGMIKWDQVRSGGIRWGQVGSGGTKWDQLLSPLTGEDRDRPPTMGCF